MSMLSHGTMVRDRQFRLKRRVGQLMSSYPVVQWYGIVGGYPLLLLISILCECVPIHVYLVEIFMTIDRL